MTTNLINKKDRTRVTRPSKASRRALLARVHIGKKELGWDDEIYRNALFELTKKQSSKDLSEPQLGRVLGYMSKCGAFKNSNLATRNSQLTTNLPKPIYLIQKLWQELQASGAVTSTDPNSLNKFVKRQVGIDRLEWINSAQASQIIESLKKWQKRVSSLKAQDTSCEFKSPLETCNLKLATGNLNKPDLGVSDAPSTPAYSIPIRNGNKAGNFSNKPHSIQH